MTKRKKKYLFPKLKIIESFNRAPFLDSCFLSQLFILIIRFLFWKIPVFFFHLDPNILNKKIALRYNYYFTITLGS